MVNCTADATRISIPQSSARRISFRVLIDGFPGSGGRRAEATNVGKATFFGLVATSSISRCHLSCAALHRFLPLILASALIGAACSSSSGTTGTAAPATNPASGGPGSDAGTPTDWPYQFRTTTVDGSSLDTGDYAGQDLVLWFWAPW